MMAYLRILQASYLLSIVGFANMLGRIAIGLVSDSVGLWRIWIYIGCVMTCGLSTVLSVLCTDYACLQLYSAVYGAAGGDQAYFISLTHTFNPSEDFEIDL